MNSDCDVTFEVPFRIWVSDALPRSQEFPKHMDTNRI